MARQSLACGSRSIAPHSRSSLPIAPIRPHSGARGSRHVRRGRAHRLLGRRERSTPASLPLGRAASHVDSHRAHSCGAGVEVKCALALHQWQRGRARRRASRANRRNAKSGTATRHLARSRARRVSRRAAPIDKHCRVVAGRIWRHAARVGARVPRASRAHKSAGRPTDASHSSIALAEVDDDCLGHSGTRPIAIPTTARVAAAEWAAHLNAYLSAASGLAGDEHRRHPTLPAPRASLQSYRTFTRTATNAFKNLQLRVSAARRVRDAGRAR